MTNKKILNLEAIMDKYHEQNRNNMLIVLFIVIAIVLGAVLISPYWLACGLGALALQVVASRLENSQRPLIEKLKQDILEDATAGIMSPQLKYSVDEYYEFFHEIGIDLKFIRVREVEHNDEIYVNHPMVEVTYNEQVRYFR